VNYPKGNAAIGDPAWYRSAPYLQWQKNCVVIGVGEFGEAGLPFDVRLQTEADGEVLVLPHPPQRLKVHDHEPQVLIFPPSVPPSLDRMLARYRNLLAVRAGLNSDHERFKLLCVICDEWIYVGESTTEACDLHYHVVDGQLHASRPEVTGSGEELVCGCPSVAYAFPYFDHDHQLRNKE
jgi:hypothetical protein